MTTKRLTSFVAPDISEAMQQEASRRGVSISTAVEVACIHWLMTVGAYPTRARYQETKGGRK